MALPNEERKKVAEKLWASLSPENIIAEEDEKVTNLLDERWEELRLERSKVFSSNDLKNMISALQASAINELVNPHHSTPR